MNDPYRACRYRGVAIDPHEYVGIEDHRVSSALRLAFGIDPVTTALVVTAPLRGPLRAARRHIERALGAQGALVLADPALLVCVIASALV